MSNIELAVESNGEEPKIEITATELSKIIGDALESSRANLTESIAKLLAPGIRSARTSILREVATQLPMLISVKGGSADAREGAKVAIDAVVAFLNTTAESIESQSDLNC